MNVLAASLLVPPPPPASAPPGFATLDEPLTGGLPHTIVLDARFTLIVAVPTGLAQGWREAAPSEAVAVGTHEDEPRAPQGGLPRDSGSKEDQMPRHAARLLLRLADGRLVGAAPLAGAGRVQTISDPDDPRRALLHLVPLAWDIRAGNLVGPGDLGSRIRFAWRDAAEASLAYVPPAADPRILPYVTTARRSQVIRPRLRAEIRYARLLWTIRRTRLLHLERIMRL